MSYDPTKATITDKVFAATLLKAVKDSNKIDAALPEGVKEYLDYVISKAVDNIEAEITLDMLKNIGGTDNE